MLDLLLKEFTSSSRKSNPGSRTRQRLGRRTLQVERLESRDLPAPLTFFAGPALPAARGGAVAAADQGSAFTLLGGGPSNVLTVNPADPPWAASVWSDPSFEDLTSISPGVGIIGTASLLVFGGNQGGAVADAFRYDPATGPQQVASMHTPRELLGYATDQQGKVYAIGGIDDNGTPLASMEYYTQSTNAWTFTSPLPQTLYAESAAYDGNGHIFTFGGVGAGGTILNTVYEYTIATNSWSVAAAMPSAVRDSAAVLASNNLIYVLGGKTSTGTTAAVESYNPATNTWNTEASLPGPVSSAAVVSDSLGRIEILGGYDAGGNALANVWVSQRLNAPDSAPAITSAPPTTGKTGVAYSYQVLSTANPQATYALTTGPTGMSIDPNKGLIQWTPGGTQIGSFPVTVAATNYAGQTSQSFTINVTQSPPTAPTGLAVTGVTISSISLSWNSSYDPIGVAGYTIYHFYQTGHSGRGGGITNHYDPVLTVNGTTTTGTVTGLSQSTSYTYLVRAFDSSSLYSGYSNFAHGTTYTLPTFTGAPASTTYNLTARHAFSLTLTATGNPTNFSYSIVNPPTGMTVDPTTGVVSWTPPDSYVGTTNVTFQVSCSAGTGNTVNYNFAVAPNLPVPQYKSANLINGTLYATPNGLLTMQLYDNSSHSTVTWSLVSGPAGMTVNATTGVVSWKPPASTPLGTVNGTFQATNYAGSVTLDVPIDVVFASRPTTATVSNLTSSSSGDSALVSWGVPGVNSGKVATYEVLVTQPGGSGTFTTTYTVPKTALSLQLTGLDRYSYITVEVVAVDAKGDLGMPKFITFVSP
jgi:hypothetical protein